ncbi:MAG: hypothetical protein ACD_13C00145G0041 [uncultured bacterium]|uniref:Glycosyl transferase family 2 n=1 Tax=Candidatus Woesebacteria bacterium GW2011_GWA1_40_43 TaxID=1618553 RepID=A0A0G0SQB6_9BACT|nr:MAG: hypothetical protein ACD_13C00145G0041 [uncultured bacterium]KKR52869.1 MAG: glycosyl transferase family 2 [Candidatus Woesebacteria bacterium GW2011_GWD2_40_19]KKR58372.1 MAG: glycosyl transferase family 2 [Candidatus Woesebacteria bacterium GW2011_GWC2_40_30]KKR64596.1 MAG: glycosyl transferase family 2 [Candidatus Woesebacteria bacterium GW2011_GWA1_40_43]HAU65406.1 hypothetical protein [Candidatus Woesebacteria bacterium]
MQKNNRVSVVVVHYGHGSELFRCLDSLAKVKRKFRFTETILVDNNEEKIDKNKILKNYPWVRYIPAPKNLGWCEGHNLGFKLAKGEYIFSLDSDVLIDVKSFKSIYETIRNNQKIGIVSPRVRNISGEPFLGATLELTPLRGVFYLSFIKKSFLGNSIVKDHLISDWDRKTSRYVEVVQLGAFIMRKDAYEDMDGFDKDIFLYFHEDDVSKRLREKGWKLFFDSKSEAIHLESKWTPKNTAKIRKIWAKCRFHYFKKHYGVLSALLVETFARFSKYSLILMGIFFLGAFLRFYKIQPNLILNGEMGTDYMNVWNIIHGTRTFLIGPRTSHEWFFIPPISYWIYTFLLFLGKYNPVIVNIFWAFVGSSAILVCYYYVKKLFDEKVALIASFLLAVSPTWIYYTRASRYNAPAGIIFFPYLYYLAKSIKNNGKSLGILGFILGLSMSFFPSPFLLIPAAIVCFVFFKVKPRFKYVLYSFAGFLIPNITFVLYEISDKFAITTQILSWIPYRILGFFGLYHKNTVSSQVLSQNVLSIYKFFEETFVPSSVLVSVIIFSFIIIGSIVWFAKSLKNKNKKMAFILVFINLAVSYLGLFVHGDPPPHYYLVIFPVPLILAGYILVKTFKKTSVLILFTLLLGGLGIWNLDVTNWFYQDKPLSSYSESLPPYIVQLAAVNEILLNSKDAEFSVARIGMYDQFDNNFANNYIYLLTIRGAKVKSGAKVQYTIVEDGNAGKTALGREIWTGGGLQIFKLTK